MNEKTRHRGPDQEGFYLDGDISLGSNRLAIIDLSEKGRQPIFNEDKSLFLIFNGEIYNFKELRQELEKKGHKFFSETDTEAIIHLFEEYGPACLKQLNGIFAFAIWNKKNKELFLARDRIGIKPLYYWWDGKRFIFSSEIKAILKHRLERQINLEALNHYLRLLYVPEPLTMFKGISKLPPASFLILKRGQIKIEKYWQIKDFEDINSKEEVIERVQYLTKDSIRRQLVCHRPLGIFLSGGIDSSSTLGIAREFLPNKIKTYSVGFKVYAQEEKFNSDFYLARMTSQYFDTDHHELLINGKDVLENLEKVIYHLDEPISNPTQIATFLLAKFAEKEVTVVLGGDGGDELFGGYPRYQASFLLNKYQILPYFLRKNILSPMIARIFKKRSLKDKIDIPRSVDRWLLFMAQKKEAIKEILKPEIYGVYTTRNFFQDKYFSSEISKDFEKYFMLVDLKTWLADESLMRTDKMTMAFGLEERVPILDHRLVELAFKIPTSWKIRGKNTKWIFKEAMRNYLPEHVFKSSKRGWFSPASQWLRKDLRAFAWEMLSEKSIDDFFKKHKVRRMFQDHLEGKRYNLNLIWALITFQIWRRIYFL